MKITDEQKQLIVGAIVGAALMLAGMLAQILGLQTRVVITPAPTSAPSGDVGVQGVSGGLLCKGGASDCVSSWYGRDLSVYSDAGSTQMARLDGATGNFTHKGFEIWTPATSVVVTNATIFTVTGSYQPITASLAVTPTICTACATAGQLLLLVNTSANAITIVDTGNQVLAGDFAIGQYDTLLLIFDGTRWIERARSNN